ncbi:uncharacterized protein [Miscanthus floridulus]|uniref:uncharacterized protein n=1 Tax=Miscanthus floridulus TaxID=154761 RepID=UPI00345840DD
MLNQSANNWLLSLWDNSIRSWDDLKKVFTDNYMAMCEQPGTKYDLEKLHQSSRESLQDFIRRFSETRNSVPNITDAEAIAAFTKELQHEQLYGMLYRKRPTTIGELIQTANGYADAEEAERSTRSTHHQRRDDDRREDRRYDDRDHRQDDREPWRDDRPDSSRGRQGCHRWPDNSINTIDARTKRTYDANFSKLLDGPCPIHKDAKHTMRECRGLKTALGGITSKKPWCDDDETEDGQGGERGKNKGPTYQDPTKTVATIFGERAVSEDKREHKLIAQRIMSITTYDGPIADPKYLDWSEHPITFSRADQWSDILYPGRFSLILDPIIKDVCFQKVLIDGGSALNILKASLPLGQITLPVQFGTAKHIHIDYVNFLVADFNTAYHAILGRPALAMFMAVPHYMYLGLKMLTKQGVLSLHANLDVAYSYEKESFMLAEATDISIRM